MRGLFAGMGRGLLPRSVSTTAAVLGALLLGGCGDMAAPTDLDDASAPVAGRTAESGGTGQPDYLLRADGSLDATPFRGIRRLWQLHGDVTPEVLEVREEVAGDGSGSYAIDFLDFIEQPQSIEESMYSLTHARSTDVFWRTREFRLRGLGLALQNYQFNELQGTFDVAGHDCRRVDILRNSPLDGRLGHYVVDIEPVTGFVLAWTELDANAQPLVQMTYESISFQPDLSSIMLSSGAFAANSLDLTTSLDGIVDFEVLVPDVYPTGFELAQAVTFSVPASFTATGDSFLSGGDWVRFTATDGIEPLTFAHGSTMSATSGFVQSTLRVVSEGAWEYGFGRVNGVSFVVAGRVSAADLRRLVESAF